MTSKKHHSYLTGKAIITWHCGKSPTISKKLPHALWVSQGDNLSCKGKEALNLQRNRVDILHPKMGGDLRREEPDNMSTWKAMPKVWAKLEKGHLTNFMEKLEDYDKGRVNLVVSKISEN